MQLLDETFLSVKTCVSKVEPQRVVLNRKMSSPLGSSISSDMRWNVDKGTTIRRRQNFVSANHMNASYSPRQRCIPNKRDKETHQTALTQLIITNFCPPWQIHSVVIIWYFCAINSKTLNCWRRDLACTQWQCHPSKREYMHSFGQWWSVFFRQKLQKVKLHTSWL